LNGIANEQWLTYKHGASGLVAHRKVIRPISASPQRGAGVLVPASEPLGTADRHVAGALLVVLAAFCPPGPITHVFATGILFSMSFTLQRD